MSELYASITDCDDPVMVNVTSSHSAQIATANFEVMDTDLDIGSEVEIDLGYNTPSHHHKLFTGYVKSIDRKEPDRTYQILASDTLTRAADYFIASTNPKLPFSRSDILLEDLVSELLALAGLTLSGHDDTSFTIGTSSPVEINLTTCLDYCRYLGNVVTWSLWSDEDGNIYFKNRKPYIMPGDSPTGPTLNTTNTTTAISSVNGDSLRNKIVIYGNGDIYAVASAESIYLPADYYKTVVVNCVQLFVTQEMAQMAADYNLIALNRLTNSMSITAVGNPDYMARDTVIANFPTLGITNIEHYIYACEHNWSSQGYTTKLELKV